MLGMRESLVSAARKIRDRFQKQKPFNQLPAVNASKHIEGFTFFDYIEPYTIGIIFTICGILGIHLTGDNYMRSMTTGGEAFPFTFQGLMWLVMGIGVGTLCFKYARIKEKKDSFLIDCFPSDPHLILDSKEIAKILLKLKVYDREQSAIFPRVTTKVLTKYQTNKSVEEAQSMLSSQVEIMTQRSDTEYNSLRYYSWLLPSLGFMGTVYGISEAVAVVGQSTPDDPDLLKNVAVSLAVAFDTTLLALIQSSLLLFFMNKLESREEKLNVAIEERVVDEVLSRLK